MVPGSQTTLLWATPGVLHWDPIACSQSYNVYRLSLQAWSDTNHDGLADSYGTCLQSGLSALAAEDASSPLPGWLNGYLVSGDGPLGEGSLGFSSSGLPRVPASACP